MGVAVATVLVVLAMITTKSLTYAKTFCESELTKLYPTQMWASKFPNTTLVTPNTPKSSTKQCYGRTDILSYRFAS